MYFFHQIFVPSEIQRHSYIHTPIFSALLNLTFLTLKTQKFKFDKFLPRALSTTQNEPKEPKRSQINPHFDHETAVHILLEEAAYRCFDLAHTDLAHLSPNCTTHLKSLKKGEKPCVLGWFEVGCMIWAQVNQISASQIKSPAGSIFQKYIYSGVNKANKKDPKISGVSDDPELSTLRWDWRPWWSKKEHHPHLKFWALSTTSSEGRHPCRSHRGKLFPSQIRSRRNALHSD